MFLDEIGELPSDLQTKLLRALQEKEVRPLGGAQAKPITGRVLASSGRDLAAMVEQGKFRKDLFFRLNVVNLKVPALRERRADIPFLAIHFLARIEKETGFERTLSDDSLRLLVDHDWPDNVRELENLIEGACTLGNGPELHVSDMPLYLQAKLMQQSEGISVESKTTSLPTEVSQARNGEIVPIVEMEKQAILETIRQLKGDKIMAAKLLGIGKTTLYRKLKEYGLNDPSEDSSFSAI